MQPTPVENYTPACVGPTLRFFICPVLALTIDRCGAQRASAFWPITAAEARIGRPLTPMSYAGVARRTTRRAVVGGAAVGAAAVGTACVRVLVNGAYVCR